MQREKLYNLHQVSLFHICIFCFQNQQTSGRLNFHFAKKCFSQSGNLVAKNFVDFERKNYNCKTSDPIKIEELFTLHLLVYFFFGKMYLIIKI